MTDISELPPQEIKHPINLHKDVEKSTEGFGRKMKYIDKILSKTFLKKYFN